MYKIIFLSAFFPVLTWAQQDCKETPSDLESKEAIQIDTTRVIDPQTYNESVRVTRIYHMEELPIVERKKVGKTTYFYVEKNDCLVIRHLEEYIK